MSRSRRLLALGASVTALGMGASAAVPAQAERAALDTPTASIAKSCKRGKAVRTPDGKTKCLFPGQYCKRSWEATYRKAGFTCQGGRLRSR